MNGIGLTTVGRLLGHRSRETMAIYAHLDDTVLRDAVAQVAAVIARAMDFRGGPLPLLGETDDAGDGGELDRSNTANKRILPPDPRDPAKTATPRERLDWTEAQACAGKAPKRPAIDWLGDDPFGSNSDSAATDRNEPSTPRARFGIERSVPARSPPGRTCLFLGKG